MKLLKDIQLFFEKVVNKVESNNAPFSNYLLLFAAILFLRLALEFFSSGRLFRLDDILHIGLWFIFIVLAFLIQLHLFSGEKILKVARLVIVFFSIALTAPIIDLIISGGKGAKMNYLSLNSMKDIGWSYITIGGSSLSRGATIGIRVEILLLVLASFNYVRTKRNSIAAGLISALFIYTVLFLSGAVPLLLGYIVGALKLQYEHDDQSTVLLLLTLDVFLLLFAFYRHAPKLICKILNAAPWGMVVLSMVHFISGAMISVKNYPGNWKLTPTTFFWFPLLFALLLCFAGYTGLQQMKEKYSPQSNRIKNGLILIVLMISSMISATTFFTAGLLWGLIYLLYERPLQLRHVPFIRNLLGTATLVTTALIGFASFKAPMIGFPATWILVILGFAFIGSFFTELGIVQGNLFSFLSVRIFSDAAQKIISILLLLVAFILTGIFFLKDNHAVWLFYLSAVPPVFLIYYKPFKTQLILLSLLPAYVLLIFLEAIISF